MKILITFFNLFLYQPLFNLLILFYRIFWNFGLAIIFLTLLIRLLLSPLEIQSLRAQKVLSELQPKIKEIQEKYKGDREKQTQLTMELYQKEKINPFAGCLPLLIQLPILIALYQVVIRGFKEREMVFLYPFVPHPGQIETTLFGLFDLARPNIYLALLVGIFQFFQSKMTLPKRAKKGKTPGEMIQKQMPYFLPFFTILILWKLPSALALYWLVTLIFTLGQQHLFFRKYPKI